MHMGLQGENDAELSLLQCGILKDHFLPDIATSRIDSNSAYSDCWSKKRWVRQDSSLLVIALKNSCDLTWAELLGLFVLVFRVCL